MTIKELTEMVESIGKCKVEWEGYRAYHTETGRLVAEYNPRTGRLIMMEDGEDENGNFIEEVACSNPEQTEAPAPVTKTSGVFKVVTDRNPDFYYVGASSQIEIAFRDYMNWVTKGKAPKAIQEEADRHDRNPEIFRFEVLEEMEGSRAELNERKKKWIGRLANNQPEPETEQELTIEERNRLILERLAEGKSVAEVAEEFGISKSTVYNVRNSQ